MFIFTSIFIHLTFILVFGIVIFSLVSIFLEYRKNKKSPRLIVPAKVVAKRHETSFDSYTNGTNMSGSHTSSSTSYYITFEVESKDRMEFIVSKHNYGLIVENDEGRLEFQGTRFISFDRY